jgi:hypothetical protein
MGLAYAAQGAYVFIPLPVQMREEPTLIATAADWWLSDLLSTVNTTAISIDTSLSSNRIVALDCVTSSGLTTSRGAYLAGDATPPRTMTLSSEL